MGKKFTLFVTLFLMSGAPLNANPVEQACMRSGRAAATTALCGCIGNAAVQTLNFGEQRQAARLFSDPDRAEVMRMSSNRRDETFWENYQRFGEAAEAMCG